MFRRRVPYHLRDVFTEYPSGLTLQEIEELVDRKERGHDDIREVLIESMAFEQVPYNFRFDFSRYGYSGYREFWRFKGGRYFSKEKYDMQTRSEFKKNIKEFPDTKSRYRMEFDAQFNLAFSMIYLAVSKKNGSSMDNILSMLGKEFPHIGNERLKTTFIEIMGFHLKHPYERVYFDRCKLPRHSALEFFTDWEFHDGKYYYKKNNPKYEKDELDDMTRFSFMKPDEMILLDQLSCFAISEKMSNSDFLRMYSYARANFENTEEKNV
jgi:hypothetical protein